MARRPRGMGQLSRAVPSRGSPVGLVQLHDALLQLPRLVGGEAQLAHVVAHVLLGVMVTQLGLDGVGAQQGVGDEGAGQAPRDDVGTELQAQVVSAGGAQGQSGPGWGSPGRNLVPSRAGWGFLGRSLTPWSRPGLSRKETCAPLSSLGLPGKEPGAL